MCQKKAWRTLLPLGKGAILATIQKRNGKNGPSYRVMVRMKGFPPKTRTFKRLTDAKQWAQDTESGIRKGEFKNVVRTAGSKTLQDVIDRFRKEVFIHRAESTKRAEASFLNFWERELGGMPSPTSRPTW